MAERGSRSARVVVQEMKRMTSDPATSCRFACRQPRATPIATTISIATDPGTAAALTKLPRSATGLSESGPITSGNRARSAIELLMLTLFVGAESCGASGRSSDGVASQRNSCATVGDRVVAAWPLTCTRWGFSGESIGSRDARRVASVDVLGRRPEAVRWRGTARLPVDDSWPAGARPGRADISESLGSAAFAAGRSASKSAPPGVRRTVFPGA